MLKPESLEYIKSVSKSYGAQKVLLFGSCLELAEEEANDIDLVVYGLDSLSWWKMQNELTWPLELGGKSVDLIRAENRDPIMVFAREGALIYEREHEPEATGVSG